VKDNFMFVEPRVALLGYTLYQLSGTIEQATYFVRHVPSDWFADVIRSEYKSVFFALGPARDAAAVPGQVRLEDCQLFTKALTRTCACKIELKKRFGCCCSANMALYSGEQRGFFLAQYTPGTMAELSNIYREAGEAYPDDVHMRTGMIERLKLLLPETGDAEGVQRAPWFKRHGHLPEECTTCHELFYVKIVHATCGHQVACSHFKCFSDFFVDPSMKFRSSAAGQLGTGNLGSVGFPPPAPLVIPNITLPTITTVTTTTNYFIIIILIMYSFCIYFNIIIFI
jgi:hypothetical protein